MAVSQQQRQSQLFQGESWQSLYTAFTQVNFNSYDFTSIRSAMVDYIRLTYPETFNDWIESSEFVAIIDLLAYLGTSLAFRMDLNTRENFLDTAQRRDSIFKLARMLNYQPQRNYPSFGQLKIQSVSVIQDIYDSNGLNLNGMTINWNDQNNQDWLEQFILVMNSTFNSSNQWGNPVQTGTVNGVSVQSYQMNNSPIVTSVIPFSATVGGNQMSFEAINPNFVTAGSSYSGAAATGYFYEQTPNPIAAWNIIYQNDNNGYASPNTGFFVFFKQGTIGYQDYQLDLALANRVLDVNVDNINQTDVWLQSIDSNGLVTANWTQVTSTVGTNIIYNSLSNSVRNIFSVITRDNNGSDQISLSFADGAFGNVPTGLLRVWYRVSNGTSYSIRPNDMSNVAFSIPYVDNLNNTYTVNFSTSLGVTVDNSQATQTNAQIKLAASQVYYTQGRMVNNQDYNVFPLSDSRILKLQAVNRVYSGQNAYLDINDPTGNYQNTNQFADDGILYCETTTNKTIAAISSSTPNSTILNNYIQPLINSDVSPQSITTIELRDFYYVNFPSIPISANFTWQQLGNGVNLLTGAIFNGNTAITVGSYASAGSGAEYIFPGSLVKFANPNSNVTLWSSIDSVVLNGDSGDGSGRQANGLGCITVGTLVPNGYILKQVYASFNNTFNSDESNQIISYLNLNQSFGIGYNYKTQSWYCISNSNLSNSNSFSLNNSQDQTNSNLDSSWLIKLIYNQKSWTIITRAQRYIFESVNSVSFYFNNIGKVVDIETGLSVLDSISILSLNPDPNTGLALNQNYIWRIKNQEVYPDGYLEPRAVRVTYDYDQIENTPLNPVAFLEITGVTPNTTNISSLDLVFWKLYLDSNGYTYYQPTIIPSNRIYNTPSDIPPLITSNWKNGDIAYVISTQTFYQYTVTKTQVIPTDVTISWSWAVGRSNLNFQWKHYAPYDQRIDPAIMNIIDVYVLTSNYDSNLRNWIYSNGTALTKPSAPTSNELANMFENLENYKMMTDQIVWHSVNYKLLFGQQADPNYQVVFYVVPATGTTASNNEIQSLVINAINNYFSLNNWDFGQTFFFTELSTYIHIQLSTIIGSIVLVPLGGNTQFGNLFEITSEPHEILISCAQVTDIQIVSALTDSVLGISTNG